MDLDTRQKNYESNYDYQLLNRVPVIIRLDGKAFSKVTKKLQKPYCPTMLGIMGATLKKVISEIDGAIFGYQQSDEITFVLKNNQTNETQPWFGNRLQKLCSVTASMVTYNFLNYYNQTSDIELVGNLYFDARAFVVPDTSEAANNLIFRQNDCIRNAITRISQYHIYKEKGRKTGQSFLHGKSIKEQIKILNDMGVDYKSMYPVSFRNGICVYKTPKLLESNNVTFKRNKWNLEFETPNFIEKRDWLLAILDSGSDIFRAENNE